MNKTTTKAVTSLDAIITPSSLDVKLNLFSILGMVKVERPMITTAASNLFQNFRLRAVYGGETDSKVLTAVYLKSSNRQKNFGHYNHPRVEGFWRGQAVRSMVKI